MFFEIRKFPIFRRFDVFWQKNDDFSENSSYAYLHVLTVSALKVHRTKGVGQIYTLKLQNLARDCEES